MTVLDDIVTAKKISLNELYQKGDLVYWKDAAAQIETVPQFYNSLSKPGLSLIAEIKKASPSKGVIRETFEPQQLAKQFQGVGATALSILTETDYFLGSPSYVKAVQEVSTLPIIRKDFIVDEIQLYESKVLGVDAVLLIKSILTLDECHRFLSIAKELSLDVLLEIHDESELMDILTLNGVRIVGINNRNLSTFEVDTQTSLSLFPTIRTLFSQDVLVVAESGYNTLSQLKFLHSQSFNGVLIGEGLATDPSITSFFSEIK